MDRCMNNPKEQIKWEILMFCSAIKFSPKQHFIDSPHHKPGFPRLLEKWQSGCLGHAKAPTRRRVDSLSLKAPAHHCCLVKISIFLPLDVPASIFTSTQQPSDCSKTVAEILHLPQSLISGWRPTLLQSLQGSWSASETHRQYQP